MSFSPPVFKLANQHNSTVLSQQAEILAEMKEQTVFFLLLQLFAARLLPGVNGEYNPLRFFSPFYFFIADRSYFEPQKRVDFSLTRQDTFCCVVVTPFVLLKEC